jgi:addiction module HigA family antidote
MSDTVPIHPGKILSEEFLAPLSVSQSRLARDIAVPTRRINEICLGKRSVTPDTALRLARFFGTTPDFWMNLQARYDLECAKETLQASVDREVRPLAPRAA